MSGVWREGDPGSLTIDLQRGKAVAVGDWIATEAGARYLVTSARPVASRRHSQRNRYACRVLRLARELDVPADVHCWWMTWYPR